VSVTNMPVTAQVSEPGLTVLGGEDECGIRDVLDRLGDRWTVLVIVELIAGTRRFRELQRAVPGISQRMLTVTTKRLCRDGLVERDAYPTIPPRVDYRLTALGRSLAEAILGLANWSRDNRDAITTARDRWDADHPEAGLAASAGRPRSAAGRER
jgi:DNA-binding HxlR family transcriptional regulator